MFIFSADEHRHFRHLAATSRGEVAFDTPDPDAGVTHAITPTMREIHDHLGATAAAWATDLWRVLDCNAAWDRILPGVRDSASMLHWMFFDPRARTVILDWESEALLMASWLRGALGYYPPATALSVLLAELSESPDFTRMWDEFGVVFERPAPSLHIVGPDGVLLTVLISVTACVTGNGARLQQILAVPRPYRGAPRRQRAVYAV